MGNREDIVEEYLKAIVVSLKNSGTKHFWPAGPGQIDSYFIDLFAVTIFEKFKKDKEEFKRALLFLSPNTLRWFLLPFVILGLKLARKHEDYQVESQEMVDFIKSVREVLEKKVGSHPFCLDGKNKILSAKEVQEITKNVNWFSVKNRQPVNFLSVDLESFVWSTNFDLFAYSVTWHGPYQLLNEQALLGKKFFDLNSEVWKLGVKYSGVDLFFVFKEPISVQIDFMTHMYQRLPLWERLIKYAVVINKQSLQTIEEIQKLDEYFEEMRDKQTKKVESLSPQEIIQKGIEINYYMLRNFFAFYHEDWYPSRKVYERIESWGLKYWQMFAPKKRDKITSEKFFRRLYDPRNNFTD